MSKLILIDALYKEEIRIGVLNNDKLELINYQSDSSNSTKGNIYLAKVEKVEPSLQAVFVNYGGNKHGFLPFDEIHLNYFHIKDNAKNNIEDELQNDKKVVEECDEEEDIPKKNTSIYSKYKIQDVIKRDQVVLVQVVKNSRGNKGVTLSTFISLAGRYSVFMPNSTKNYVGISKKIDTESEKIRLKELSKRININDSKSGVILRTAAIGKTESDIIQDIEFLSRLWKRIREYALAAKAPCFIYQENDIIKKVIRDFYNNSIDKIIISGNEAFRHAMNFADILIENKENVIEEYTSKMPIFSYFNIEKTINNLYQPRVTLKSGGYLIINQTEALVSIDVNSGKSTKEFDVENTALKTNMEAVPEIVSQLMLRDLSGIIAIDFIDMSVLENRKTIEKALAKEFVKDKSKIQIGRVTEFGIVEISRQRMNSSFEEVNTIPCTHCGGKGKIRSLHSSAISILRNIEAECAINGEGINIINVLCSNHLMFHLISHRKRELVDIEDKFNVNIEFQISNEASGDDFFLEVLYKEDFQEKAAISVLDEPYKIDKDPSTELIVTIEKETSQSTINTKTPSLNQESELPSKKKKVRFTKGDDNKESSLSKKKDKRKFVNNKQSDSRKFTKKDTPVVTNIVAKIWNKLTKKK